MRQTTEDWLKGKKNPFKFTGSDAHASGMMHHNGAMLIFPISKDARFNMMTTYGQPYNEYKNERFQKHIDKQGNHMRVENLRMALKDLDKGALWNYHGSLFDPALIKLFIKPYKRANDEVQLFTITPLVREDGSLDPDYKNLLCMHSPDGDWGCYIAPRVAAEVKDMPSPKTFNPTTGVWE